MSKKLTNPSLNSEVKISGTSFSGILLKHNEKNNVCEVDVKGKIIKVAYEQLKFSKTENKQSKKAKTSLTLQQKSNIRLSLDLHGFTKVEASEALISFIDLALRKNVHKVEIVHGHGNGILKRLVQSFLAESEYIASFKVEDFNTGATIAYLK